MQGNGRLSARQDGNEIVITSTNGGSVWIYVAGSGRDWVEVPLDADGRARVPIPAGAEIVTVSDRHFPDPSTIDVDIVRS